MKLSENIANLAAALAKFQAEVIDPTKDENNPFFKSKYVPLDGLIAAVRPVLTKHGLSYLQFPSGDGQNVTVTTVLLHESGEYIESDPFTLRAAKVDAQGAGSAVTYARRYSLSAILGVAWQEDDDGNAASTPPRGGLQRGNNSDELRRRALHTLNEKVKAENVTGQTMSEVIAWKYGKQGSKELTLSEIAELTNNLATLIHEMEGAA